MSTTKSNNKPLKRYIVNFDMPWSYDIKVTATGKRQAKILAWIKFFKMIKKSSFSITVDEALY